MMSLRFASGHQRPRGRDSAKKSPTSPSPCRDVVGCWTLELFAPVALHNWPEWEVAFRRSSIALSQVGFQDDWPQCRSCSDARAPTNCFLRIAERSTMNDVSTN